MRNSARTRSISYLKANASRVLATLLEEREPLLITRNGEVRAVLQDVSAYEQTQETLALFKLLVLAGQDIEAGRVVPLDEAVRRIRERTT